MRRSSNFELLQWVKKTNSSKNISLLRENFEKLESKHQTELQKKTATLENTSNSLKQTILELRNENEVILSQNESNIQKATSALYQENLSLKSALTNLRNKLDYLQSAQEQLFRMNLKNLIRKSIS